MTATREEWDNRLRREHVEPYSLTPCPCSVCEKALSDQRDIGKGEGILQAAANPEMAKSLARPAGGWAGKPKHEHSWQPGWSDPDTRTILLVCPCGEIKRVKVPEEIE